MLSDCQMVVIQEKNKNILNNEKNLRKILFFMSKFVFNERFSKIEKTIEILIKKVGYNQIIFYYFEHLKFN